MLRNVGRIVLMALFLLPGSSLGQVATGAQVFGSFGGGPFDIVNLGNLNTHFDIPIIQKAGRGAPYAFTLSYDTSVWYPVTSSGTTTWTALPNYGWNFTVPQYAFGYVTANTLSTYHQPCNPPNDNRDVTVAIYGGFVYIDATAGSTLLGAKPAAVRAPQTEGRHPFPPSFTVSYQSISGCAAVEAHAPPTSGSSIAVDGSGYTVNASGGASGAGAGIVGADGKAVGLLQTSSTTTDANGNQVTSATDVHGNMQVTDTLGQNVLTISGTNPVTVGYTAPGGPASYTINYTSTNIWTNFGCASIVDPTISNALLITSIVLQDGTSYQFTYEANTSHTAYKTGRLASVSLPTGGSIAYQYTGANDGANCTDGSTLGLTRAVTPGGTIEPAGTWTYGRAAVTGGWQTTVTSPPDPVNTGNAADVTLINFAKDSSGASQNFFETQRLVYQGAATGTPLETMTTCYNTNYSSCSSSTVSTPINQIDAYTQLGSGQTRASEIKYDTTGYGLVTDDKEYDYGVTLGIAPLSTKLLRETVIGYASLTNGIVNAPSSIVVKDGSGATASSTTYSYDQTTPTAPTGATPQHTTVTGSRGNLTTVATQVDGMTTLYRVFKYYDTGNVLSATDLGTTSLGGPNLTIYNYPDATSTCGNAFPASLSEPLPSLSQSYTWNCVGGVMTQATDENGQIAKWDYTSDPDYWRPDFSKDRLLVETDYSYSTAPAAAESFLKFNGTTSVSDLRTTVDGFGRPMLSQQAQTQARTQYDSTQTNYDVMGRAYQVTMPFQAVKGGTTTTAPNTTTTFDALNRPIKVVDGNGATTATYVYTNNDVLQTVGSLAIKKQLEYDGLGRLTWVCEVSSSLPGVGLCGSAGQTGYWTQYTYNALGSLLTVNQNSQPGGTPQTRTFTYDMLSRLKTETNPETGQNGASGTTTYTYDAACTTTLASPGDLTKKVDNAGHTTCFGYDGLHRLINAGFNTTCRRFRYDSQTPPSGVTVTLTLGRLAEAYTDNCSGTVITDEWFGYDADGQLLDFYEKTPNSGGYYHSVATYWQNGAINGLSAKNASAALIFPTIYYGTSTGGTGLDGEGRYLKVNGSTGTNPVTGVTYTASGTTEPIGSLTKVTYGSVDNDNFTYDTGTGRLGTYTFAINSVNDKGTLTWNTNGTVSKLVIADSLSGSTDSQTCNYYYDDLGRLGGNTSGHSVDCGSTKWQQLFTFDAFGNIVKSGSSNFAANYSFGSGAITNQLFQVSGASISYDSDGNILTDNLSNTYTWDPNWGNPASVNTTNLIYDALGQMVEQQNGSAYTQILYSEMGKTAIMSGQTLTKAFVYLPGGGTAIYGASGPTGYRHADWLGSSRVTTNPSRVATSYSAYAPFGEQYTKSATVDPSFATMNTDTNNTLYDATFREYSSSEGRWTSPDPAGLAAVDPTNPQTWNRYAYVQNNPLGLTDSSGLCSITLYWQQVDGGPITYTGVSYDLGDCVPCPPGGGWSIGPGGSLVCGPPGVNMLASIPYCAFQSGCGPSSYSYYGPETTLRLVPKGDVCRGGDRTITYQLVNTQTGAAPAFKWWLTEHIQAPVKTNAGGTDTVQNRFQDFLSNGFRDPYIALQSFSISATQGSAGQNFPVNVNIGGQDYGTLGLWMSKNPLRNGQASPDSVNCPPQ